MFIGRAGKAIFRTPAVQRASYIAISDYLRNIQHGRRIPGRHIAVKCLHTQPRSSEGPDVPQSPKYDFLQTYKERINFPAATYDWKNLSDHLGKEFVLHGYLGPRRDAGPDFCFVPLSDIRLRYSIQIASIGNDSQSRSSLQRLRSIRPNSPVAVRGKVGLRKGPRAKDLAKQLEDRLKGSNTPVSQGIEDAQDFKVEGHGPHANAIVRETDSQRQLTFPEISKYLEVELLDVFTLNEFPHDIIATNETVFPPEHRHLQIRTSGSIRHALFMRSFLMQACRKEMATYNPTFIEIETPLLFKSTPEGAREFLVPTRRKGMAYALPQSPQQYKQILMASGIPRYFQFAKCFRDEDLRTDRQPEFTQFDVEMSFATGADVMRVIERVVRTAYSVKPSFKLPSIKVPSDKFRCLTYQEAMSRYGSDKPDTRYGSEICRIDHLLPADLVSKITPLANPIVEVMKVQVSDVPSHTREFLTSFMESPDAAGFVANPDGAPGTFVFDSTKPLQGLQPFGFEAAEAVDALLKLTDGDLIILQARRDAPFSGGSTPMGNLRRALHKAAVDRGHQAAPSGSGEFEFLWITDFPLFSQISEIEPGQGGAAGFASTHHPFTAPKTAADVDLLVTDPTKAIGDHYDLVINGVEIGGGSRRIHDSRVQEFILKDVLKMPPEKLSEFSHLLEALRAGCPPHAGIALGFDRLVALFMGKESVRDVMAFPKTGKGEDPMVKSPSMMTQEALDTYHLNLKD